MTSRVAGIDIGGTKVDALVSDEGGCSLQQWSTRRFDSVDAVLQQTHGLRGTIDKIVIAAAGRLNNEGSVELTNLEWPAFTPDGANVQLANDVQCAAEELSCLGQEDWLALNSATPATNELVAVTISTGENSAYRDSNGKVHPAESGHSGWQPWVDALTNDLSHHFLLYLQHSISHTPLITVEDVIGGDRGFATLYQFVSDFYSPGISLQNNVQERRRMALGIGPAITEAALEGDLCAEMCMRLWGPILGQYLRERVLSHMPQGGSVYLYGGVTEDRSVMAYVLEDTHFWPHFTGGKAKMYDLMEQVSLRLVVPRPQQLPLTLRGALKLAKSM